MFCDLVFQLVHFPSTVESRLFKRVRSKAPRVLKQAAGVNRRNIMHKSAQESERVRSCIDIREHQAMCGGALIHVVSYFTRSCVSRGNIPCRYLPSSICGPNSTKTAVSDIVHARESIMVNIIQPAPTPELCFIGAQFSTKSRISPHMLEAVTVCRLCWRTGNLDAHLPNVKILAVEWKRFQLHYLGAPHQRSAW